MGSSSSPGKGCGARSGLGLKQLIGERSWLDEVFLPHSLRPAVLAQELRHEMQQDLGSDHGDRHRDRTFSHRESPGELGRSPSETALLVEMEKIDLEASEEGGGGATTRRILVDALVTTPTATTRWYQASLTSLLLFLITVLLLACGRGYIRAVLLWLQEAELAVGLLLFTFLFFLVALPLFWGYLLLLLAAGYLYGYLTGPLVALACSGLGLAAAHVVMRTCCRRYFRNKLLSGKVQAVLAVVNKGSGFKIVALTRLTPIPFGLQNALFSLSDMPMAGYLAASVAGLGPMACLYCYLGSTLRTMEDVLTDQGNQLTGWFIFGGQLLFTVALLFFVARKAREELRKAMEQSGAAHLAASMTSGSLADIL